MQKHFAEEAENAVWVVKNGWQVYPGLVMDVKGLPPEIIKVQWRSGATELVYRVQVFETKAEADLWVASTWTVEDAEREGEWQKEGA